MEISICIVSYNVRKHLKKCLESIYTHVDNNQIEVLVVDNCSSDSSNEMIENDFPDVKLFPMTENLGFAAGANIALKAAVGKFLFLLNPDTLISKDTLTTLIKYLEENPQCGIVGPQLRNEDASLQNGLRRFPTPLILFLNYTFLFPFLRRYKLFQSAKQFSKLHESKNLLLEG